ncbi:MAG: glycosyltransferase family 39 protein [Bacillota bacterium]|nr:glycosyltransferase family 39 protein [Bacillota bacterium]MDW7677480.1 glycosyltransferase family 39 protein [Bacillota bacterium]
MGKAYKHQQETTQQLQQQPSSPELAGERNPFQLLDRWPVIPVVTGVFAVFAGLIMILGVFTRGPELLEFPSTLFILYSLLLAAAFAGLFRLVEKMTFLHKPFVFPVLVTGLAFVPRYIWIRLVETTPLWDFARYLNYARSIVAGDPGAIADIRGVFPHLTGYPLVLSWVMRIFGTEVSVARWFNLFCTLAAVLLLYQLGKTAFSPGVGRGAALLFALWPGQVFYSSVLGAEHLFVMLMLAALFRFALSLEKEQQPGRLLQHTALGRFNLPLASWGVALAAGAVLAVAHIVRPVASLLFPAFFLYLLVKPVVLPQRDEQALHSEVSSLRSEENLMHQDQENPASALSNRQNRRDGSVWRIAITRRVPLFAFLLAGFFLVLSVLNAFYEPQVLVPLGKTGAGFNLYVGTNKESRGMWNPEDWAIIGEYEYDFDRIHEEAWNRGIERIQEDYRDFLLLAERKFAIQWSVSDYGFYWGMLELDRVTAVSLWAEANRTELQVASQVYYLSLLWLVLLGLWKTRKNRLASFNTLIAILFFGFIAMHTLIEVQSRYHHSLVPLFMLSAAYGASFVSGSAAKRKPLADDSISR